MKIINALSSGFTRSLRSWKGVLAGWFIMLVMAVIVALPLKAGIKTSFGSSMITGTFSDGINLEAFSDMGLTFSTILSFFRTGMFTVILAGFVLNVFISGGLFHGVMSGPEKFKMTGFWSASARNFWSFLVVGTLVLSMIILTALVLVMPVVIASSGENVSDASLFRTGTILFFVFILFLSFFLSVADYARAWQVKSDKIRPFTAIGSGFRLSVKTFLSSWPLMMVFIIIQSAYMWIAFKVLRGIRPDASSGIFLLFLLSQFMFFIRLLIKNARYAGMTVLMESYEKGAGRRLID